MILFLFALLTVASGRVYPRSGVDDDVEGLMYEIPEYEDPELVLFNLAARGAMPVLKLFQQSKDSEDSTKEKDTTRYLKIADVKKELDEIISGLQTAKTKGKHNLLMEIINAMQYLSKLKHHLFSIDISKFEEEKTSDDEAEVVLDIPKKYSSDPKISEKSSVTSISKESSLVSDTFDKSPVVFETSGESPVVSDTSNKSLVSDNSGTSSSVSETSGESPLVSYTSDKSLVSDTSGESHSLSDTSNKSLVSYTSEEATVTPSPLVPFSPVSHVSAEHSAEPFISYEHLKDSDLSRDKYLYPYSLIRHISISDFPSDDLLAAKAHVKKDSVSDIPAVMSFISDTYKGRYPSSDGSANQHLDPRDEEVKKEIAEDEFQFHQSTVEPQITKSSSDAENIGFEKKVKTLVDDNMYISENNQDDHAATIMSKKLTWKLRGLVEKPNV